MKIVKRVCLFALALVMTGVSSFSFVGCDKEKNEDDNLSFASVSTILTDFNENLKPFLATLEFKYNNTDDEEKVKLISSSISSLTRGMSESMKAFQAVFNQYIETADEETQITSNKQEISVKTDRSEYRAKLNSTDTDLSIYTKDGESECLYEVRAESDGGYLLQIISKNTSDTTYTIYQLDFNGTRGKLCVDESASSFIELFNAEVSESTFPHISQYTFSS